MAKMNLNERIASFSELGIILDNILNGVSTGYNDRVNAIIENQINYNPWFTPDNVRAAIRSISNELTTENLIRWTDFYPALKDNLNPANVGVIMAGNIPAVGFHDFLSVLITGNNLIAKTSSKDPELIKLIGELLCSINGNFNNKITFTSEKLTSFDMIIATGSDNSSRYFDYYFGKYPNIIRRNRTSAAILDGDETPRELESLGRDIFSYFGLGCRNVSKLFLPAGYDLVLLTKHWERFSGIINHHKYANNYDFSKAVYLVNREPFYDNGYLLMKEDSRLLSPVAVVHFEFYDSLTSVRDKLIPIDDKIQCIIGKGSIPFGKAQSPKLWDYADGIDTIEFLLKKNIPGIY